MAQVAIALVLLTIFAYVRLRDLVAYPYRNLYGVELIEACVYLVVVLLAPVAAFGCMMYAVIAELT